MSCQKNNEQFMIKLPDLFDDLIAADRTHQKVQQQDIKMFLPDTFNGFQRIAFDLYLIAAALKIRTQRQGDHFIIIENQQPKLVGNGAFAIFSQAQSLLS